MQVTAASVKPLNHPEPTTNLAQTAHKIWRLPDGLTPEQSKHELEKKMFLGDKYTPPEGSKEEKRI